MPLTSTPTCLVASAVRSASRRTSPATTANRAHAPRRAPPRSRRSGPAGLCPPRSSRITPTIEPICFARSLRVAIRLRSSACLLRAPGCAFTAEVTSRFLYELHRRGTRLLRCVQRVAANSADLVGKTVRQLRRHPPRFALFHHARNHVSEMPRISLDLLVVAAGPARTCTAFAAAGAHIGWKLRPARRFRRCDRWEEAYSGRRWIGCRVSLHTGFKTSRFITTS